MSAQVSHAAPDARPDDPAEVPWRRLDARMIWVDAVRALLSLTPGGLAVTVFGVEPDSSMIWPVVIIAVVGVAHAAADLLRWVKTRYRVTREHVERRTGLLVRSYRSVRRDRIRSVDTTAKLRHRLAGLRLVTIGAGQQATAGEAAFALDAVSRGTAEELRHELLGRVPATADAVPYQDRSAMDDSGAAAAGGANGETVIQRIRWSWTFYNVFNLWAFLMAAGILWGGFWLAETFGLEPARLVAALVDWRDLGLAWSIVLGVAAAGVLGVLGLSCNFVAENWRFRLSRTAGEHGTVLRTSQGLFKTREINRDDNRLRGIEISQPLLWRWIGAADTNVISTGLAGFNVAKMENPASMILPRTPIGVARRVAAAVLGDEARPLDAPLRRHPGAALRRRALRAVLVSGAVVGGLAWMGATVGFVPGWAWLAGLAVLPLALALAAVAYRALGHALAGRYLVTRSGLMNRSTAALQRRAVIGWTLRQSVLQRRLGLLTVSATTAAGHGAYAVTDADADDALALADTAVPGLLAPFLDRRLHLGLASPHPRLRERAIDRATRNSTTATS